MERIDFDFDEQFFPRSTEDKLNRRDENKTAREKYADEYKKELRKKTRDREKKAKKEKQMVIKNMTDGKYRIFNFRGKEQTLFGIEGRKYTHRGKEV
jgi:hypothetical protein